MLKLTFIKQKYPFLQIILNVIGFVILTPIRETKKLFGFKGKSIVVISFNMLGDTVFTIPAIKEIKNNFNDKIYIMCYPESKPIYEQVLKNIIYLTYSKNNFYLSERIASFSIRKALKKLKPKIIFDLTGSIRSSSIIFNSGAKYIIGSNENHFKSLYTHFNPLRSKPHLIERYIDAISSFLHTENKIWNQSITISRKNNDMILINPFAGWKAKEWNLRKFINLSYLLNSKKKVGLIFQKGCLVSDVSDELISFGVNIIETETIVELIYEIEECGYFIGNDSGPLNIASLLIGKPTFTIFGPTNPLFHNTIGERNDFISNKIKCSPINNQKYCFTSAGTNGCPAFQCMHTLQISDVISGIKL